MGGLKCHACRRFVLRRAHVIALLFVAAVAIILLLEVVARLTPPPLK